MRCVTLYQTRDGKCFPDPRAAKRHAEDAYGVALSNLAHRLLRADKYSAMMEALEECAGGFADLAALRADIALDAPEECDE
jgi:hypothetical protein